MRVRARSPSDILEAPHAGLLKIGDWRYGRRGSFFFLVLHAKARHNAEFRFRFRRAIAEAGGSAPLFAEF